MIIRQVFMASANLATLSFSLTVSTNREEVWPIPPSSTSLSAFSSASSKFFALYIASTGESFS